MNMLIDNFDVEIDARNPSVGDKTVFDGRVWTLTGNRNSRTLERPGEKIQVTRRIKLNRVVSITEHKEERKRGRPEKAKEEVVEKEEAALDDMK